MLDTGFGIIRGFKHPLGGLGSRIVSPQITGDDCVCVQGLHIFRIVNVH